MQYEIYYRAEGLPKNETALSAHQIEHHAFCLPADLRRDPGLRDATLQMRCVLMGEQSRVEVVLEQTGDSAALHEDLGAAVRRINRQTSGLCFVIDSFPETSASEA